MEAAIVSMVLQYKMERRSFAFDTHSAAVPSYETVSYQRHCCIMGGKYHNADDDNSATACVHAILVIRYSASRGLSNDHSSN